MTCREPKSTIKKQLRRIRKTWRCCGVLPSSIWHRDDHHWHSLTGNDEGLEKAKSLLEKNADRDGKTLEDRRALAIALGQRPDRKSTDEAIKIFEEVVKQQPKYSIGDNYLLADLYARIGDWPRYSRVMRSVLGNGGAEDSRIVLTFTEALVQRGELGEAQLWFSRLKTLAPKELTTDTIEARLLFGSAKYQSLIALLERNGQQPERAIWSAEMAEMFGARLIQQGQVEQANKLMDMAKTQFSKLAASDPKRSLALAAFYARRGQIDQAIDLLGSEDLPPDQLSELGQGALKSGQLSHLHFRQRSETNNPMQA
jgi:tetratricopeptide (TPR) repeat protein